MRTTSVARPHLDGAKRTEPSLTKNHKEGQGYSSRKALSVSLGSKLSETIHHQRAKSVFHCAELLEFQVSETIEGDKILKLTNCWYCKHKLCSVCQHKRSIQLFARIMNALERLTASYRKLKPILLTLTVPNCDVTELRETIGTLNKAFKKLTRNRLFPGQAWIKSVEITRNKETGLMHPHLHVLLLVSPSYFGPAYWNHERWLTEWRKATGDDRITQVDVRRVKGKQPGNDQDTFESDLATGVVEVAKYCVKSTDLVTDDITTAFLEELVSQIKSLKFIAFGGFFKQFLSETLESEDTKEKPEIKQSWLELYKYHSNLKDYLLTEIRSKTSSN